MHVLVIVLCAARFLSAQASAYAQVEPEDCSWLKGEKWKNLVILHPRYIS